MIREADMSPFDFVFYYWNDEIVSYSMDEKEWSLRVAMSPIVDNALIENEKALLVCN